MYDSPSQIRFERWWTRAILVLVAGFSLWFIVAERDGLLNFLRYLADAVAHLPAAVANLFSYYAALPVDRLVSSVLLGAVFGALSSVVIVVPARMGVVLPPLPPLAILTGLGLGFAVLMVGGPVLFALAAGWMGAFGAGIATSPPRRHVVRGGALRPLWSPRALKVAVTSAALGGLAGGVGGQLLVAVLQHCTYAPDAPLNERQIGHGITILSAALPLIPLWVMLRQGRSVRTPTTAGYFRSPILPFVLLAPTLVSLVLFLYLPSIQSVSLSLKLRRFPLPQEQFVCLRNYTSLAEALIYRNSFVTTLSITAAIVILSLSAALGIAVLASQRIRGASIYRTFLIWPFALSPIVAGTIFLAMFRDGGSGLINAALAPLGISLSWLRDPTLAPWVVVIASVWNILGFNILFYIAGLQNVPPDLLEAAQIDGASRLTRFLRITVPLLAPYTFFLLVTNITYSFYGVYGAVDALTQGGPPLGPAGSLGGATNVLIYKLYEDGFAPGAPIGLASAQALILFVMVAGLTILQFRVIETRITYGE